MSDLIARSSWLSINDSAWEAYRRPYVRDLAYVLACPTVLTRWLDFSTDTSSHPIAVHSRQFWLTQFAAYQGRLAALDNTTDYQHLTRYLLKRPSPNRLGFHFEGLLSFWLADGYACGVHPFETLASNVQLFEGKQTTGELDLILYNHTEKLTEHWELAIKFFMGSAPYAPKNWVGINANDNLARKITHMQTKPFGTLWVDTVNHGRVKIDKRYGVIKGRFFLSTHTIDFAYPEWLSPHFPMHEWYDKNDEATFASLDASILRQAHYIEWFTERDFYKRHKLSALSLAEDRLPTGLYFEGHRPLVIYPHVHGSRNDKVNS